MNLFIKVLDNGYTLSVTTGEEVEGRGMVEVKTRYAFETVVALKAKLNELLPEPRNDAA
jgi:hypothetical protein